MPEFGGGLLLILALASDAAAQESGRAQQRGGSNMPQNIGAWLHIAESGRITVFSGKAELGQNIRTSLTQAVAPQLRRVAAAAREMLIDLAAEQWKVDRSAVSITGGRIDVVLVDLKDLPSADAGETAIVGIAPAIGNAVFDAVGKRLQSLPMRVT